MDKWCPMDVQQVRVSADTGKTYKKWIFVGWTRVPDLEKLEHTIKGQYAIVTTGNGLERYDLNSIVER